MVQVPMDVLRLIVHRDLRGAKTVLLNFLGTQSAAGQAQRANGRVEGLDADARVDQCGQRHIAADAAATIQICHSCHVMAHFAFELDGVALPPSAVITARHSRGRLCYSLLSGGNTCIFPAEPALWPGFAPEARATIDPLPQPHYST